MPNSLGRKVVTVGEAMAAWIRLSCAWEDSGEKRPRAEIMVVMLWDLSKAVMVVMEE